jgi:hypothetical protein
VRETKGFSWELDLTFFADGNPIGGIEVKKELSSQENRTVIGEIFDQLMHFKYHWGIKAPFVILTSYKRWRVCWLNDTESNELASRTCALSAQSPRQTATTESNSTAKSPPSCPEHRSEEIDLGEVSALG